MIPRYEFACTCLVGRHPTPTCPYKAMASASAWNRTASDIDYRTRMLRRQWERDGLAAPEEANPWRFRWWWIPLGLTVWIALIILI